MNFSRLLPIGWSGALLLLLPLPARSDDLASALYKQSTAPVEQRIQDLLGRMTPEEKARQLDLYSGAGQAQEGEHPPLLVDHFRSPMHAAADAQLLPAHAAQIFGPLGVGGIHDLYPYAAVTNSIQDWLLKNTRLGIPALFIEEGLHGLMSEDATLFPAPINLGSTWDPDLARRTGAAIGAEIRARGIEMCLGPVLDLAREPRWDASRKTWARTRT